MNHLAEYAFDSNVICDQIIWLAGNMAHMSDALEEAFEDGYDEVPQLLGLTTEEADDLIRYKDDLLSRLAQGNKFGFLVQARTPIPSAFLHLDDPRDRGMFSWGITTTKWFYTSNLDQTFYEHLSNWRDEVIERERKRQKADIL